MPHRQALAYLYSFRIHIAMSFTVANSYIRRRGRKSIIEFLKLCNEGKSLAYLASRFGVSIQRVSVLRSQLFVRTWTFSEDTLEALKFERHVAEHAIEEVDEALDLGTPKTTILRLPVEGHNRA